MSYQTQSYKFNTNYNGASFSALPIPSVTSVAKQDVVCANDKAVDIAAIAASLIPSMNTLVAARKEWEAGVYRTSSLQLYSILADCLRYYDALIAAKEKDAISIQFKQFCEKHEITFKKGTQNIFKVVKCVFYDAALDRNEQRDRRRISAYATVLRLAINAEVKADNLVSWIEQNGGIEDIRVGKAGKTAETKATKQTAQEQKAETRRANANAARAYMLAKPALGVASGADLAQHAPASSLNYDVVLIARQQADGTFAIFGVVRDEDVVVAAQADYFKNNKAALEQAQGSNGAADEAATRAAKINAAAAA